MIFSDDDEATFYSAQAAQSAVVKLPNAQATMSSLEHNSLAVQLALILDMLSDPKSTSSNVSPNGYAAKVYDGPNYQNWTLTGKTIACVGLLPEPTDTERRIWWDAIADLIYRLKVGEQAVTGSAAAAVPADTTFVAVFGHARGLVFPPRFDDGSRVLQENADAATVLAQVLPGTLAFCIRLQAIANGSTDASVQTAGTLETSARPQMQVLADEWNARTTRAAEIAGTVLGVAVLSEVIGGLTGRRRRR